MSCLFLYPLLVSYVHQYARFKFVVVVFIVGQGPMLLLCVTIVLLSYAVVVVSYLRFLAVSLTRFLFSNNTTFSAFCGVADHLLVSPFETIATSAPATCPLRNYSL